MHQGYAHLGFVITGWAGAGHNSRGDVARLSAIEDGGYPRGAGAYPVFIIHGFGQIGLLTNVMKIDIDIQSIVIWIKTNKEWFFSGFGVFILGAIGTTALYFWRKLRPTSGSKSYSNISDTVIVNGNNNIVSLNPDINKAIDKYMAQQSDIVHQLTDFCSTITTDIKKAVTEAVKSSPLSHTDNINVFDIISNYVSNSCDDPHLPSNKRIDRARTRAFLSLLQRNRLQAIESYKLIMTLNPDNPEDIIIYGKLILWVHNNIEAQNIFRSVAIKWPNSKWHGQSRIYLGIIESRKGAIDNAIVFWNDAIAIFSPLNDQAGIASAKANLTDAYTSKDDFSTAEKVCNESLLYYRSVNNNDEIGRCYSYLSHIMYRKGLLKESAEYCNKAIESFKLSNNYSAMAKSYNSLAITSKTHSEIMRYYDKAIECYKIVHNEEDMVVIYLNIAVEHKNAGNIKKAFDDIYHVYRLALEHQNDNILLAVLANLSAWYKEIGNQDMEYIVSYYLGSLCAHIKQKGGNPIAMIGVYNCFQSDPLGAFGEKIPH